MLDSDIKLVNVSEQRLYNPDLTAEVSIRIAFMVGKHGPFVEKFPKDEYSAAARDARLNTFAAEVR